MFTALARDLRDEIFSDFPTILKVIASVSSSSNDPEVIEAAFTSLMYLMKYLMKSLVKNFEESFHCFFSFIQSSSKDYIRSFAVECFAYILKKRKRDQMKESLEFLITACHVDSLDVLSQVLIESCVGVQKKLHSCAQNILKSLLEVVYDSGVNEKGFAVLKTLSGEIGRSIDGPCKIQVWNIFMDFFGVKMTLENSNSIFEILYLAFRFYSISDSSPFFSILEKREFSFDASFAKCLALSICKSSLDVAISKGRKIVIQMLQLSKFNELIVFYNELIEKKSSSLEVLISPIFSASFEALLASSPLELAAILAHSFSLPSVHQALLKHKNVILSFFQSGSKELKMALSSICDSYEMLQLLAQEVQLAIIDGDHEACCSFLHSSCKIFRASTHSADLFHDIVSKCVELTASYPAMIVPIADMVSLRKDLLNLISVEWLNSNVSLLKLRQMEIRNSMVSLLALVEGQSSIYTLSLKIDCPIDLQNYRDRIVSLKIFLSEYDNLTEDKKTFAMNFLIGLIKVNFSLLAPEVYKVLGVLALKDHKLFWCAFQTELRHPEFSERYLLFLKEFPVIAERENHFMVDLFFEGENSKNTTFLQIFSKFTSPKTIYKSDELYCRFLELLCNGDSDLQSAALSCVLVYKDSVLTRNKDLLHNLIEEKQFREEVAKLMSFEMGEEERSSLIPIVIRILYGKMLTRKKKSNLQNTLEGKRKTIMKYYSSCSEGELKLLHSLILQPFMESLSCKSLESLRENVENKDISNLCFAVDNRKLLGFVNILEPYFRSLTHKVFTEDLKCIVKILFALMTNLRGDDETFKALKSGMLKRIIELFLLDLDSISMDEFMVQFFKMNISPIIKVLPQEYAQSPSNIIQLFVVWSENVKYTRYLFDMDAQLIPQCLEILLLDKANGDVIHSISMMLKNLVSTFDSAVLEKLFTEKLFIALERQILLHSSDKARLALFLEILRGNWDFKNVSAELCHHLCSLLLGFLKKSSKLVNDFTKSSVIQTLSKILPRAIDHEHELKEKMIYSLSPLFISFNDRNARMTLNEIFYGTLIPDETLNYLLSGMNSFIEGKVDEPDYEKRISCLIQVTKKEIDMNSWIPILYNLFYHCNDEEEMAIRGSAASAVVHFIERVDFEGKKNLIQHIVNKQMKEGLKSKSEAVKIEYLSIFASLVKQESIEGFALFQPLLSLDDDEGNFFFNIYHLQTHRRLKAIRKFSEFMDKMGSSISPSILNQVFLPLFVHFIFAFSSSKSIDHNVVNESIAVIGCIFKHLSWPTYFAHVKQFLRMLKKHSEKEKYFLRLLISILNNFHFSLVDNVPMVLDGEEDQEEGEDKNQRMVDQVSNYLIPEFYSYFTKKDNEKVVVRSPVAIAIIQILIKMPIQTLESHLPKIIISLSQLLKDRLQDVRDAARETMVKILDILGVKYFGFIVKEMSDVLTRGYQLHVLGYTLHSLLLSIFNKQSKECIDYCLEHVSLILMNEIFGQVAVEKETEELTGKSKEMKFMKAYDSFELLVQMINPDPTSLNVIVRELKNVLSEHSSPKALKKVDLLTGRLAMGLAKNELFTFKEILLFCYPLIKDGLADNIITSQQSEMSLMEQTFTLTQSKSLPSHLSTNSHLLSEFGLKIVGNYLKKEKFDDEELAMLAPYPQLLLECSKSKHNSLVVSSLKVFSKMALIPLNCICAIMEALVPFLIKNVLKSVNLESDLCQASFKLLSLAVKLFESICIAEDDLKRILEIISVSLNHPEKHQMTFSMVKAILARKIVSLELYDLIDQIAQLMITSQSNQVRSSCRQIYLIFFLDYPIGRKRLEAQMNFLLSNLTYTFESGRLSVMEMLMALVSKLPEAVLFEFIEIVYVVCISRIVSEEAEECVEKLKLLIAVLIEKSDENRRKILLFLTEKWLKSDELLIAGLQSYNLMYSFASPLLGSLAYSKIKENLIEFLEKTNNRSILTCLSICNTLVIDEVVVYESDFWTRILENILAIHSVATLNAVLPVIEKTSSQEAHLLSKQLIKFLSECRDFNEERDFSLVKCLLACIKKFINDASLVYFSVRHLYKCSKQFIYPFSQQIVSLKVFGALSILIDSDEAFSNVSFDIMRLAMKSNEWEPIQDDNIRSMGQELLELCKKKMTDEVFYSLMQRINEKVKVSKDQRRQRSALMAVADPQLASELKMKRNLDKRAKRSFKKHKR